MEEKNIKEQKTEETEVVQYIEKEQSLLGKIPAGQAEKERLAWNMLEHNDIKGIGTFLYYYLDDFVCFRYQISSCVPVLSELRRKRFDFSDSFLFCRRLFEILESGGNYFLKEKDFLLKAEWIFWSKKEKRLFLCYLPGRPVRKKRELLGFFEIFMQHIDHKDRKSAELIYGIYEQLAQEKSAEEISGYLRKFQVDGAGKGGISKEKREGKTFGLPFDLQKDLEKNQRKVGEEKRAPETEKIWHIGRAEENDICIPNDCISRRHLRVFFEEGQYYVMDLGTKNGTCLHGKRLVPFQKVKCGKEESLYMANLCFSFYGGEAGDAITLERKGDRTKHFSSFWRYFGKRHHHVKSISKK